jgi:capsular polysaccharide biosynthesis protein
MPRFYYPDCTSNSNILWTRKISTGREIVPLTIPHGIRRLISHSQPISIFDENRSCAYLYGGEIALLRSAIVVPDCYELFNAPWSANVVSYPSNRVRDDWKRLFPHGHCATLSSGGAICNYIEDSRFDYLQTAPEGRTVFIIKNHCDANNYWHWTYECLPRLFELRKLLDTGELGSVMFYVLGSELKSFQKEWIKHVIGFMPQYTFLTGPLLARNLLHIRPAFPSHCSKKYHTDALCCIMSAVKRQVLDGSSRLSAQMSQILASHAPLKSYIRRGRARNGRNVINEDALVDALKPLGFTSIALDDLSICEQALIFRKSQIVIGPHGAAFANIIFCRGGTRIVEIFSPSHIALHGAVQANIMKLDWHGLVAEAGANTEHGNDFSVDIDQIIKLVDSG